MKNLQDKDGNQVVQIAGEKYIFKKPTGATLRLITNNYGKKDSGDLVIEVLGTLCISHGISTEWFDKLEYDVAKEVLELLNTFQLKV